MIKKILILILTLTKLNIFSGAFDCERVIKDLLKADPANIALYESSITQEQKNLLRQFVINKYRANLLDVIKPGIESLPYIQNALLGLKPSKTLDLENTIIYGKFVKNDRFLITVSSEHQQFDIWEIDPKGDLPKKIKSVTINNPVASCSDISPGGQYVLIGNIDGTVILFDLYTNRSRKIDLEKVSRTRRARFSADGKYAIIGNVDGYVYRLNCENLTFESLADLKRLPLRLALSKDGKYALYSDKHNIFVENIGANLRQEKRKTPELLDAIKSRRSELYSAIFSPYDNFVYITDGYEFYCIDATRNPIAVIGKIDIPALTVNTQFESSGKFAILNDNYNVLSIVNLASEETHSVALDDANLNYGNLIINSNATMLVYMSTKDNKKMHFLDASKWAIEDLSVTQLLTLVKATQEKDPAKVMEYYNYLLQDRSFKHGWAHAPRSASAIKMVENFFKKKLMSLYFDAPTVLHDLVKQYM